MNRQPVTTTKFGGKVTGRVVVNMWRVCRSEFKYTSYTLNNVYSKLFGESKPVIHAKQLGKLLRVKGGSAASYMMNY